VAGVFPEAGGADVGTGSAGLVFEVGQLEVSDVEAGKGKCPQCNSGVINNCHGSGVVCQNDERGGEHHDPGRLDLEEEKKAPVLVLAHPVSEVGVAGIFGMVPTAYEQMECVAESPDREHGFEDDHANRIRILRSGGHVVETECSNAYTPKNIHVGGVPHFGGMEPADSHQDGCGKEAVEEEFGGGHCEVQLGRGFFLSYPICGVESALSQSLLFQLAIWFG